MYKSIIVTIIGLFLLQGCNNLKRLTTGKEEATSQGYQVVAPPKPKESVLKTAFNRIPNPPAIWLGTDTPKISKAIVYLRDGSNGVWMLQDPLTYRYEFSFSLGAYVSFNDLPRSTSLNGLEYYIYIIE